jgi:AraC-like DNA-binding protein
MDGGRRTHSVFLGGAGVRYEERPPHPALAPWVAVHWRIEADVDFELRIPPDGCMDVIGADAIGSFTTFGVARLSAGSVSSGIRFHPGGFPALFGVPASELLDLRVPLRDVVRRFRSLERLAAEAAPPDPLARAVWSASDLGTIARSFGYGERQLRRRIVAATGHAPKRLMRIARMQRPSWTAAARAGPGRPSSTATTTRRTWPTTSAIWPARRRTRSCEVRFFQATSRPPPYRPRKHRANGGLP